MSSVTSVVKEVCRLFAKGDCSRSLQVAASHGGSVKKINFL